MEKTKKRAALNNATSIADGLETDFPGFDVPGDFNAILTAADDKKPALKPAWATVNLPRKLTFRNKPTKRIFYDYSEVAFAVKLIAPLPRPGETVHAIMDSHFKGIDLVPAILDLAGRPADELIVTTLGFNRRDAACLCELAQRRDIRRLTLICSNFFAEKDQGAYDYARAAFAEVGATLAVSRNHSKLLLFDFTDAFYTVESSANLRSCNNFEQFALSNSRSLHKFHRTWVTTML